MAVWLLLAAGCGAADATDTDLAVEESASTEARGIAVPWRLDFGRAQCDAYPWSQSLTISSSLDESVSYEVRQDFRSSFEVWPDRGTIRPRGRADVRVTPKRPIGADAVPPGDYRETLTVRTTGALSSSHYVELRRTVVGALVGVEPRSIPFGALAEGEVAERDLVLTNDGNETATVSLSTTPPFSVEQRSVTVLPRSRERVRVTFTAGTPGTSSTGSISVRATRACNDVPSWISVSGHSRSVPVPE